MKIKLTIIHSMLLTIIVCFTFLSCAKEEIDLTKDDIQERYDKGLELLKKRKYYRSQEHFQYV